MNLKSTLIKFSLLLAFCQGLVFVSSADPLVYCSPTFANSCAQIGNRNQAISLGTINWTIGVTSCSISDYTHLSTTLDTGVVYPMSVTNGSFCGCTVWIDFNQNQLFDSTENFFHQYVASGTHTYNFNITIPGSVYSGTYRMRVLAGWGTDGYTYGSGNGWGGCGSFQYGNFDDFTVVVNGAPVGISNVTAKPVVTVEVFPNPVASSLTVLTKNFDGNDLSLQLNDVTGKMIRSFQVKNEKEVFDISDLSSGIYMLKYEDGIRSQNIRIVK